MFGNPETTTGGQALKFYASVRMEIRRVESIKQGTDVSGNRVRVKVVKNKVAPPFRTAEFDIMFNEGISRIGSIVDLGTEMNVLKKSGAFYSYGDQRLGQGRENVKDFLKSNPEITDEIEAQIRSAIAAKGSTPIVIGVTSTAAKNGKSDDEDEEEGEF
jgi:recombination protein RecA